MANIYVNSKISILLIYILGNAINLVVDKARGITDVAMWGRESLILLTSNVSLHETVYCLEQGIVVVTRQFLQAACRTQLSNIYAGSVREKVVTWDD